MSSSYGLTYTGTIQGSREEMEKLPAVVRELAKKQATGLYNVDDYKESAEELASCAKQALESGGPLTFSFELYEDDSTHGIPENLLNCLDQALPGLAIFLYGSGGDIDGYPFYPTSYVSPPGKSALKLEMSSPFSRREDWGTCPFQNCQELTCLRFPDPYQKRWAIAAGDFKGCVNLTDIILPSSVTKIAKTAFKDCKSLTIHAKPESFAAAFAQERSQRQFKIVRKRRRNFVVFRRGG